MNFKDLLLKHKENKTRVIINGLGTGETKGTIIAVNDDYIEFELLNIQKETKSNKEKTTREVKHIPLTSIFDLSEGEKEKITEPGLGTFAKK
ncbi:MAG: hypothetical protein WCE94_14700 [Candidatus Methanoperedens sp.]